MISEDVADGSDGAQHSGRGLQWQTLFPRSSGLWPAILEAGDRERRFGTFDPQTRRLVVMAPGEDPALARGRRWLAMGELVAYRAGHRAVVRVPGPEGTRYVKIVRPKRAPALIERLRLVDLVWRPERPRGGPALPALIECHPDDGVIVLSAVPGESFHDRLMECRANDAIPQVGLSLARMHAGALPDDVTIPEPHPPSAAQWVSIVERFEPRSFESWLEAFRNLPVLERRAQNRVLIHGDLHDRNILVAPDAIGLIDTDMAFLGEAEEDLGNLCAHLVLRALQRGDDASAGYAAADRLLAAYAEAGGNHDSDRVRSFRKDTFFRLASIYLFRRQWRHLSESLLREAVA